MDVYELSEKRRIPLRRIADFSSLVNPLGPPNRAKYAIRKAIKELTFFPDESARRLKRLLARLEGVSEEHIFLGHGSEQTIQKILEVLRPKRIGLFGPLSRRKRKLLACYELLTLPHGLEGEALSGYLEGLDLLFLSNPDEVEGRLLPASKVVRLIGAAEAKKTRLLIDESLRDFLPDPPLLSPLVAHSRSTILIRSFSLFFGLSGLPLCLGIASKEIAQGMPREKVSSLALAAAFSALKDRGFRQRTLRFIEEEKLFIKKTLEKVPQVEVQDTEVNFLIVRIKKDLPHLEETFLQWNLIVEADRQEGHTLIRLPVKRHRFNALFVRTLRDMLSH